MAVEPGFIVCQAIAPLHGGDCVLARTGYRIGNKICRATQQQDHGNRARTASEKNGIGKMACTARNFLRISPSTAIVPDVPSFSPDHNTLRLGRHAEELTRGFSKNRWLKGINTQLVHQVIAVSHDILFKGTRSVSLSR